MVNNGLYLIELDFNADIFNITGHKARNYQKQKYNGLEALFFANCRDLTEIWLLLLEKAIGELFKFDYILS
jgi:hypothetical protein